MMAFSGIRQPGIFLSDSDNEDSADDSRKLACLGTESSDDCNTNVLICSQESQASGINLPSLLNDDEAIRGSPVEHEDNENVQPQDDSMPLYAESIHDQTTDEDEGDEDDKVGKSRTIRKRKRPRSLDLSHCKRDCTDEPCANSQSSSSSSQSSCSLSSEDDLSRDK